MGPSLRPSIGPSPVFPIHITTRSRITFLLDYLRRLRALPEGAEALIVRYLTGMAQMLWGLGREGVLLIGPICLEEQLPEVPGPLNARQESKIGEILGQLKELEDMVPGTARRCPIKFEQRAHFLQLAAAYPISNGSDLRAKGKAVHASFKPSLGAYRISPVHRGRTLAHGGVVGIEPARTLLAFASGHTNHRESSRKPCRLLDKRLG